MWFILLVLLGFIEPADYFVENRTAIGVLDRQSNRTVVSVAATGMGMDCMAIAVQEGRADRLETLRWINNAIDNTIKANKDNRGWLYHFTDLQGRPVYYKVVSSIDSALFYLGARQAARRLDDEDLIVKVDKLIAKVDIPWMMRGTCYFSHGFAWKDGDAAFVESYWKEYSEGMLLYRLFDVPYTPTKISLDLPLFTYYYPLCFYRDENMIDLLGRAIDHQIQRHGFFGVTACDGPKGYTIYNPKIISPLAIKSCEPFFPEKTKKALEKIKAPPTTPSVEMATGWKSEDHIGIDESAFLILHRPLPQQITILE